MINRGQIWIAELPKLKDNVGREQAGTRPVLILSDSDFNNRSRAELLMAIPLTRTERRMRTHIPVISPEGGLDFDSFIMCEQIRVISTERLVNQLGSVDQTTMRQVETIIVALLGLPL